MWRYQEESIVFGELRHASRNVLAMFLSCLLDLDGVHIIKLEKTQVPTLHNAFTLNNLCDEEKKPVKRKSRLSLVYNRTALEICDKFLNVAGYGMAVEEGVFTDAMREHINGIDLEEINLVLSGSLVP
ncbi:hypothetical protein AKO1_007260 [Acrasis kona]|uniref:Uncharacterized protein n=1 Tax=Acrasis kona TaxID=1008807 RepID=A0AAW2YSD5_9EUKA